MGKWAERLTQKKRYKPYEHSRIRDRQTSREPPKPAGTGKWNPPSAQFVKDIRHWLDKGKKKGRGPR